MMSEYENEPVPGLPERLPAGERVLWQGAPDWKVLARSAFHVRKLAIYFAVLLSWRAATALLDGRSPQDALLATLRLAPLAVAALGLLTLFAWLAARSTLYTITNRRLVMRFGVALPMTVNIPFLLIQSAALKTSGKGAGDISLALTPAQRIAYLHMWPHVRPWQFSKPQPTLRALPDAAPVAEILGDALSASLGGQVRAAVEPAVRPPAATVVEPARFAAGVH